MAVLSSCGVHRSHIVVVCVLALDLGHAPAAAGEDSNSAIDKARSLLDTGQYEQCLESAEKALENWAYSIQWHILKTECLLTLGRYEEAATHIDVVLRGSRPDICLLWVAHTAYQHANQADKAAAMLATAYRIASWRRSEYLSSAEMVALGQCLLLLGVEPRLILRDFYDRVIERDPNCCEAYLAAGSLAAAKQDFELAAQRYRQALKRFGSNPDVHYGLAKAFYCSDRKEMIASLDAALLVNPRHVPALLLLAEHQIDCEDYEAAAKSLDRALAVNPWHPEAWACKAVLAHFAHDLNAFSTCRANGLKFWPTNPQVDHLIGQKLSQNYRFAEGAARQRQAITFDPNYLPAKIQLAEDLLRLGDEQEGWALADEVNAKDPYNVEAYNLVNLREALSQFATLSAEGLLVRMDKREAAVYGDRVIELLQRARSTLCEKYGLELHDDVTIELFPSQQDFAVRTFGMPGGDGFLGVCFGKVITANSPSIARPSNWQAMLWHEFCHVVTLHLTHNKMPRWLSEGISVYEEAQENPIWGQRMNPQYRRMILDGELTPVGDLSAAFLSPPTPIHLQFAYYESALVVEYLVDRFGLASLKAILADLANGGQINAAISRHAGPIEEIEKGFEAFARKRAQDLAPDMDWEEPTREQVDPADGEAVARWLADHPNSFWALTLHAGSLLSEQEWEQAKKPLEKLISLYPENTGQDNPYRLLAQVYRTLGETEQEVQVLSKLARLSPDAADAYGRLVEIGMGQEQWVQVLDNSDRYLAVYLLLGTVYQCLGRACEATDQPDRAVDAYERLLLLDPADPVDVNYRLAQLLKGRDPAAAKRHILEALADAPRFRQGHKLLLEITGETQ